MKRILLFAFDICFCLATYAQSKDEYLAAKQQIIAQYKSSKARDEEMYQKFRSKANEEYAQNLRKAWQSMHPEKKLQLPPKPKPPKPPECKIDKIEGSASINCKSVLNPVCLPDFLINTTYPTLPGASATSSTIEVSFFGTNCHVHADSSMKFTLTDLDPNSIANIWEELSTPLYDRLVSDCIALRSDLHLCDWAYIQLTKAVSESFLHDATNEAVMLQSYLLTQSGLKVKMCTSDSRLLLMLPFFETVYEYCYLTIDGLRYYILDDNDLKSVSVCQCDFPDGRQPSIFINQYPDLAHNLTLPKTIQSKRYPDVSITVRPNLNLIHFLNTVPRGNLWNLYANASLSDDIKGQIYPHLMQVLADKNENESINVLLNLVQTGFEYATDQEQFGKEMPLFADQTFYYPYSDCEDRAILFSILVRELVGLKTVLLNFPGHLASAVKLNTSVSGDYVLIDGERYLICDPTYIGASLGMTMPQFKGVGVEVITLD